MPPARRASSFADRPMVVKKTRSSASRIRDPKTTLTSRYTCPSSTSTATIIAPTTALGMSIRLRNGTDSRRNFPTNSANMPTIRVASSSSSIRVT